MRRRTVIFLALAVVMIASRPANAYIDPGTGMTFVSGIGGFVAGLIALGVGAVAVFFRRCRALVKAAWNAVSRLWGGGRSA